MNITSALKRCQTSATFAASTAISPNPHRIPKDKTTAAYLLAARAIPVSFVTVDSSQSLLPTMWELITDTKFYFASYVLCLQPNPLPSTPRWLNKPIHHLHQTEGFIYAFSASQSSATSSKISLNFTAPGSSLPATLLLSFLLTYEI